MSSGGVAAVRVVIDTLADTDLDALPDSSLDAELVGLLRERHRLDAQIARRARRWDARSVWLSDGSKAPAARLSRDANIAKPTAEHVVRVARAVESMPATAAAWAAGDISVDHVDLLRRAAGSGREDLFARDEAVLVGQCVTLRYAQMVKAVQYWRRRADRELANDGPPPPQETYVKVATSFQGTITGEFMLDPIGGAMFETALRRIERELYRADKRDGIARTIPERLAAALVEMARRAAACRADAQKPGPLLMVLAGQASMAEICELSTGVVVDPHLVVPYLSEADVQTIVFDGANRPITGSRQRTFRGMLRRAIQVRDRHCQHPSGCDEPIERTDVNHIVAWADGGRTELDDGNIECEPHNRKSDLHDKAPPPGTPRAGPPPRTRPASPPGPPDHSGVGHEPEAPEAPDQTDQPDVTYHPEHDVTFQHVSAARARRSPCERSGWRVYELTVTELR